MHNLRVPQMILMMPHNYNYTKALQFVLVCYKHKPNHKNISGDC